MLQKIQISIISINIYIFKIIVISIVANKSDLFDKEVVDEEEAKQYALKNGAIFQVVSALNGIGVDALFKNIGKKLINSNFEYKDEEEEIINDNNNNNNNNNFNENHSSSDTGRIILEINKNKETKNDKYCCSYY